MVFRARLHRTMALLSWEFGMTRKLAPGPYKTLEWGLHDNQWRHWSYMSLVGPNTFRPAQPRCLSIRDICEQRLHRNQQEKISFSSNYASDVLTCHICKVWWMRRNLGHELTHGLNLLKLCISTFGTALVRMLGAKKCQCQMPLLRGYSR